MIQHTIEVTKGGYRLVVWEPAPTNTNRLNPFIFRASYLLSSPSKAHEILKMVEGEHETSFSQVSNKAIDEQAEYNFYQFPLDKLPVAFQA
jgi:hypothetical protein